MGHNRGRKSKLTAVKDLPASSPVDGREASDFFGGSGLSLGSVVLGLLDQSDDCIKIIGCDGALQFMNCNGKKVMQVDDFNIVAGKPWVSLWPEESRSLVEMALNKAAAGQMTRFEGFCPTARSEPRWWEVTVAPIRDEAGRVAAILSTSRDISERKQREETAATVALEMRHRLRNAHSVSAALLLAAGKAEPEHRKFAGDVASRLARLSEIHTRLLDVGGGISLEKLCREVAGVFEQSGGRFKFDNLNDPMLDENRARVVSLILGELATNSLKHGALGGGGETSLSAAVDDGILTFEWIERWDRLEDGVRPASSGQGMTLMSRIAALYHGTIDARRVDNGYHASVRLPLS